MDSDDSQGGSSGSSSSSSGASSRQSSVSSNNENTSKNVDIRTGRRLSTEINASSPRSTRSASTDSSSSSTSSSSKDEHEEEEDGTKSPIRSHQENSKAAVSSSSGDSDSDGEKLNDKEKISPIRGSNGGNGIDGGIGGSPNQSPDILNRNSPIESNHSQVGSQKSRRSSSNSLVSLSHSRSNSCENLAASKTDAVNLSHDDLSDVSDLENEKRPITSYDKKQGAEGIDADKPSLDGDLSNMSEIVNEKPQLEDELSNLSGIDADKPSLDDDISNMSGIDADKPSLDYEYSNMSAEDSNLDKVNDAIDDGNNANNEKSVPITDLRQKLNMKKNQQKNDVDGGNDKANGKVGENLIKNGMNVTHIDDGLEDLIKTHDEDALDFEAEEGECQDIDDNDENELSARDKLEENDLKLDDGSLEEGEELEEGEVTDEDEKRPEETEPKPVCRFYTRGQCTWGMSCRFLHPGVTDKGNYTMFDLVRPVSMTQSGGNGTNARSSNFNSHQADYHDYRTERPAIMHHRPAATNTTLLHTTTNFGATHPRIAPEAGAPVVVESAWERGLRTAKEMMRKANKRKEQDIDFEDKKMNLTLSPDEMDKDPYYLKDRATPPETVQPYPRHVANNYQEPPIDIYNAGERYGRAPVLPYDEVDPYGRTTRYRELPPHRMPQYEDDRRVRPTREVIVQRVEPVGRGDEWNDPWMRTKSPGRGGSRAGGDKRRRDRRSYSSNSSYSSSSSSQSESTSNSTPSPGPTQRRQRYNSNNMRRPSTSVARNRQQRGVRPQDSRSPIQNRARRSTSGNKRRHTSISPHDDKRGGYTPTQKRKKLTPQNLKKKVNDKNKLKRRADTTSSETGSSDSSDSESESGSSSSDSSNDRTPPKRIRDKTAIERRPQRNDQPPKKRSPISIELRKPTTVGASALADSPARSSSSDKDIKKSRREELLKQLRAVEDAIAKKRSRLA